MQLEPTFEKDPYNRISKQPIPPVKEDNNAVDPEFAAKYLLYEIKKLTNRKGLGKNIKYLVY